MRACSRGGRLQAALGLALALAITALAVAQAPPAFEVASIKPSPRDSVTSTSTFFQRSNQLSISNHPLRLLMAIAFNFDVNQMNARIVGLPGWADSDGYDIHASTSGTPSTADKRLMLQALLAERFELTFHRETRQIGLFALALQTPGRPGAELRPPSDEATCKARPDGAPAEPTARMPLEAVSQLLANAPCGRVLSGVLPNDRSQAWAGGRRVTLAMFAAALGEITPLDRPIVLDRTGLDGWYDFRMLWNPQIQELAANAADQTGLTFLQALREHLGLQLRRENGPVEVIVVDRVGRPTAD
jgi:bla regulator protein blaR1